MKKKIFPLLVGFRNSLTRCSLVVEQRLEQFTELI